MNSLKEIFEEKKTEKKILKKSFFFKNKKHRLKKKSFFSNTKQVTIVYVWPKILIWK